MAWVGPRKKWVVYDGLRPEALRHFRHYKHHSLNKLLLVVSTSEPRSKAPADFRRGTFRRENGVMSNSLGYRNIQCTVHMNMRWVTYTCTVYTNVSCMIIFTLSSRIGMSTKGLSKSTKGTHTYHHQKPLLHHRNHYPNHSPKPQNAVSSPLPWPSGDNLEVWLCLGELLQGVDHVQAMKYLSARLCRFVLGLLA